jgi:peptide/nickel transport system ATP-binding protein
MDAQSPLLAVDDLTVQFRGDRGWTTAVENVSLSVQPGECVGRSANRAAARA